jgi:hypothetical protein
MDAGTEAQSSWQDYWRAYLLGHQHLSTRLVHYAGLFVVPVAAIAAAWWLRQPLALLAVPIVYLAAKYTHPLIEGNSNEPFAARPYWSAVAFGKMLLLELSGRIGGELRRARGSAR